jgi:hypothetical protein
LRERSTETNKKNFTHALPQSAPQLDTHYPKIVFSNLFPQICGNDQHKQTKTLKKTHTNPFPQICGKNQQKQKKKQRHYFLYLNHFPKICGLEQREQTRQEQKNTP